MGSFRPLFDIPTEELSGVVKTAKRELRTRTIENTIRVIKDKPRGCEPCTLNKIKGIKKIFPTIRGKSIAVVAQSPGPDENEEGRELIGPSGRLIWKELKKVGIERDDCDVLNTIFCFPADVTEGTYETYLRMRNPSKHEIHCCSLHVEDAFKKIKAKQILVLGKVAAMALLRTRSLPQRKVFWSEQYQAKIYLVDHPSFFLRGYGQGPRYDAFQKVLGQLAADREESANALQDQFGYIRARKYRVITSKALALAADGIIRKYAATGERVCFDIEDHDGPDGKRVVSCCGFCPKPGLSFVFVFRHKDIEDQAQLDEVQAIAKALLEDETIEKTAHHGVTDVEKLKEFAGIQVRGYTHDTNLSEFLRFSDKKKYGLDELAESRFPKFSGYSQIIVEDMLGGVELPPAVKNGSLDVKYKYLEAQKLFDISKLSLDNLRLYNGADCDLGKRLEIDNREHVPQALMQLYIDLSFLLYYMEPNGPLFDYDQHAKLDALYPHREKLLRAQLQEMVGDPEYNPGSPEQVSRVMYTSKKKGGLGLVYPFEGKANTQKMTMLMLGREHKFPGVQLKWRSVSKVKSTLDGYKKCAELSNDRLSTTWWATGARTGRLSSGGGRGKKRPDKINLQNIKKDAQIQNMCVADRQWRRAYKAVGRILRLSHGDEELAARRIEKWIRRKMPDLKTFLILDYGQIEVRVAAQMSGDKNLIKDCGDSDIHTRVGVTMTGWDAERIKGDNVTRTLTKNVHFGILFGISKKNLYKFVVAMSPPDMRDRLKEEEVSDAYDRYFQRYPRIRVFMETMREYAREHGFVKTLFGMIQTLVIRDDESEEDLLNDYVDSDEVGERKSSWKNQAINGPVQGSAHQLLICAMVNLLRKAVYSVLGIPTMDVHDALYFMVRVLDLPVCVKKSKYLLEKESLNTVKSDFPDIDWKVPIAVDTEAGLRLGCKVDVDEETSVGQFMIGWHKKCKKQIIELNKELEEVLTA